MANEVNITIRTTDKSRSGVTSAKNQFGALNKTAATTTGIFAGMGAAVGAAGVAIAGIGISKAVSGFQEATALASDFNEALSKSNVVFGEAGAAIERWADTADDRLGLSKRNALDAAGTFGNMFDQLGVGSGEAAKMSTRMAELAADFASFHNLDITDVLEAQSAAFRGEFDSLQRVLPLMNAAAVQQKALEISGKANADSLTEQEKALATYQLMLEGAGKAQGDFARTKDEDANASRRAAAEIENMKTEIGQELLPVQREWSSLQLKGARVLSGVLLPALREGKRWFNENRAQISGAANAVRENFLPPIEKVGGIFTQHVIPAVMEMSGALDQLGGKQEILEGLGILAGGVVAAGVLALAGTFLVVSNVAKSMAAGLRALSATVRFFSNTYQRGMGAVRRVTGAVSGGFRSFRRAGVSAFRAVSNFVSRTTGAITRNIDRVRGALSNLPGAGAVRSARSLTRFLPGRASGGVSSGGLTAINERGTEIVDLPSGSRVLSAADTRNTLRGVSGGSGTTIQVFVQGSIRSDRDFIQLVTDEFSRLGFAGVS